MRLRRAAESVTISLPLLCTVVGGCDTDEASKSTQPRAPAELVPESVAIAGAEVVVATALMKSRATASVDSFRISRSPTSVSEYRECIEHGVCDAPAWDRGMCLPDRTGIDGPTFAQLTSQTPSADNQLAEKTPVTCVSPDQAKRYCAWVGARLATPEEWLLAARGQQVQRFAWGNDPISCDRHWRVAFDTTRNDACCGGDCKSLSEPRLQSATLRASSSGLESVLWTSTELVASGKRAYLRSCTTQSPACLVRGLEPGAIDSIVGTSNLDPKTEPEVNSFAQESASFRCVWEEGS